MYSVLVLKPKRRIKLGNLWMGAQRSLDQAAQLTWFGEPYKADQTKAKLNNRRCRVLIKKPESTLAHSTSSTKSPKTVFISL